MLVVIVGDLGDGKTLLLTSFSANASYPVVANYTLKGIPYEVMSKYKLIRGDYAGVQLSIDEAYTLLDSRNSMAEQNRLLSYILFQSRKTDVDMVLTVQLGSTLDLRFREMAQMVIEVKGLVMKKGVACWKYIRTFKGRKATIYLEHEKLKYCFSLYDTNEVIIGDNIMLAEKYRSKSEQRQLVREVAQAVMKKYPPPTQITKDRVEKYLWENEVDKFFLKYVYLEVIELRGEI